MRNSGASSSSLPPPGRAAESSAPFAATTWTWKSASSPSRARSSRRQRASSWRRTRRPMARVGSRSTRTPPPCSRITRHAVMLEQRRAPSSAPRLRLSSRGPWTAHAPGCPTTSRSVSSGCGTGLASRTCAFTISDTSQRPARRGRPRAYRERSTRPRQCGHNARRLRTFHRRVRPGGRRDPWSPLGAEPDSSLSQVRLHLLPGDAIVEARRRGWLSALG